MRPRNWWSCARPNRSAFSISITVAFGMSTPTSITVVAISRSASPVAEPVHDRLLVLGTHAPVEQVDPQVGEDLGGEAFGFGLGRLDLRAVALVDRGAHDEGLPARGDLAPDEVVGGRPFAGATDGARLDRTASRGQLVEDHDIEVAVVGERQRPRDRRGRHDQHVRFAALGLERHALVQPEPVLLVHDGQRQVGERHALLHQRVGPDHEVDAAVGDPLEDALPVLAGDGAGQHRVGDDGFIGGGIRGVGNRSGSARLSSRDTCPSAAFAGREASRSR